MGFQGRLLSCHIKGKHWCMGTTPQSGLPRQMSFQDLFYHGSFEFRLGLDRSEQGDFFRSQPGSGALVNQRRKILSERPECHSKLLQEDVSLHEEFAELLKQWNTLPHRTGHPR